MPAVYGGTARKGRGMDDCGERLATAVSGEKGREMSLEGGYIFRNEVFGFLIQKLRLF
jgi:hypothetical protein